MSRTQHYGVFYRVVDFTPDDSKPTIAVIGNCQAESLRIVLHASGHFNSFRIPPIHEWENADYEYAKAVLSRTDILISQPVRDDYRGLPCGVDQLATLLPTSARVVKVPVLRFSALNPYYAIVRPLDPPVVPYHDLRTVAAVAGIPQINEPDWRGCFDHNVLQMAQREKAHGTVVMSDWLETVPVWHTLNHPDNATLQTLGNRVLAALNLSDGEHGAARAPEDREMLGHLRTPILPEAASALGCDVVREAWTQGGEVLPDDVISQAHREFYATNPELVTNAVNRHGDLLSLSGFAV